jgi:hypothetical protein
MPLSRNANPLILPAVGAELNPLRYLLPATSAERSRFLFFLVPRDAKDHGGDDCDDNYLARIHTAIVEVLRRARPKKLNALARKNR